MGDGKKWGGGKGLNQKVYDLLTLLPHSPPPHYGSEQPDFETSNHSFSYESKREASSAEQANE